LIKIVTYSHSRLSSFEQCPLKFKYRYIDKIIPEIEKTIEAHLGTAVHDTLEWLYTEVKNKNLPTLDDCIIYYSNKWQDTYSDKIKIVKEELTAKDYFNKGVEFILNYYTKHKPFDDNTLELEKKVVITLGENNEHKLQGFIDRFVYNEEKDEYEIHDYKTAKNLPPQEKADQDRQLALYAIAIKDIFGQDKEVKLVWHYLAHNTKITSTRTNHQLENLKEEIIDLIKQIENTTYFPAQKSILCSWCEYKPMCPKFGGSPNIKSKMSESSLWEGKPPQKQSNNFEVSKNINAPDKNFIDSKTAKIFSSEKK